MKDGDFVDVKNPDHTKYPNFANITPDYKDVLQPGEIILFPSGWFHDVTSLSDSISITWNFLHAKQLAIICNHIQKNPNDDQLEIARFFLKDEISKESKPEDLITFFKDKFKEQEVEVS